MAHYFVSGHAVNFRIQQQGIAGVPAVMGRVLFGDPAGCQCLGEVFPVFLLADVLCPVMVDQASEARVIPGFHHVADLWMDRDRPVAAVSVFETACEGLSVQIDVLKRHPGKLVNPPAGINVDQYSVNKRLVLVLPELPDLFCCEGNAAFCIVFLADPDKFSTVLCDNLKLQCIPVHLIEHLPGNIPAGQRYKGED